MKEYEYFICHFSNEYWLINAYGDILYHDTKVSEVYEYAIANVCNDEDIEIDMSPVMYNAATDFYTTYFRLYTYDYLKDLHSAFDYLP